MEIIVGKTAGFCFGVKNAVEKTIEELNKNNPVYCLGELVHNKQVTDELIEKGVQFIENIEDAKGRTIIRAHGVPVEIYEKAKNMNINLKDLTCPKVLQIHKIAEEYKNKNYFIFLIGQKEHPETIGTISFCGENSYVIEDINSIEKAQEAYKNSKLEKAIIIAQTTYSLEKFNLITKLLGEKNIDIEIKNTICSATKLRQEETEDMSKKVDGMIIVGGKHSSNTNKLFEIAKKNCNHVWLIETSKEINMNEIKDVNKIGIMAGASTPIKSILEVVDILDQKC